MFNPFHVFEPRFLPAFVKKGVRAFVQQTYDRGRNWLEEEPAPAYLFIHFHEAHKAREHYEAIRGDAGAKLYRVEEPAEWKELVTLLDQPAAPRYYTALTVANVNEKARRHLDKRLHAFIDQRTKWKPRGFEGVSVNLELEFGKLMVSLRYGARHEKVELDELEKMNYVL